MTNHFPPNTGTTTGANIGQYWYPYTPPISQFPVYIMNYPYPVVATPMPDELRQLLRYAWEHGTDEDRAALRRMGCDFGDDAA